MWAALDARETTRSRSGSPRSTRPSRGADSIEFQDRRVYRELFNLHATAASLADTKKRAAIVAFVRTLIEAAARIKSEPRAVWPLVARPRATTRR